MSDRCPACGEPTIFEPDVGVGVCPVCGTLADPTQHVLASHLEHVDTSGHDYRQYAPATGAGTLKGRGGWALAGQDKEARDRRNTVRPFVVLTTRIVELTDCGICCVM